MTNSLQESVILSGARSAESKDLRVFRISPLARGHSRSEPHFNADGRPYAI